MTYEGFARLVPDVQAALRAMTKAVDESGLDKGLTELIKVRASQLNGCAFCLQFHLTLARQHGVPAAKLDLAAAWRDAGVFSAREMAALAYVEALTRLADHEVMLAAQDNVLQHFSADEARFLTIAIATINAWNRLGVALALPPQLPAAAAA
jgi:AhpD family alkylhydroperoxidase